MNLASHLVQGISTLVPDDDDDDEGDEDDGDDDELVADVAPDEELLSLGNLGLCQRRWDARLAGHEKRLSHSGQRYST